MIQSRTTRSFRDRFASLPAEIQIQAVKTYRIFRDNPHHPGLQFKKIEGLDDTYSVRIGLGYRAVGVMKRDAIVWFWIGNHADYDRLL